MLGYDRKNRVVFRPHLPYNSPEYHADSGDEMNQPEYRWVARALEYLDRNFKEQPSLEELSSRLDISPFHVQRVFKRWVGLSPKRFLQVLTKDYSKALLEESRSVLDVAFESGLSGPGRLHDLFTTLEAMTPGEYKADGGGLLIRYGVHDSPFGSCLIGVTDRGICWMSFHDNDGGSGIEEMRAQWTAASIQEDRKATAAVMDSLFPSGLSQSGPSLPLLVKGTNFQIKVWEALLKIPAGCVASYGDIARRLGSPRAGRAVGNAVAANSISYLIPCHRVIRSLGNFGRYRWGRDRKRAMLAWEAARQA
jgi:AraC family transcriptional regulator of adaptative response/methylated-DNA-[protein]-cysteine methyltransferase